MANTNYPSASQPSSSSPSGSGGNKNLIIGLLVATLLGTWGYMMWTKNNPKGGDSVAAIPGNTMQTEAVMTETDSLKQLFTIAEMRLDSITGATTALQGEKSALQREIEDRKNEIRKILNDKAATAADLQKARRMIGELNGQIGRLETQITQLKGENQELTSRNTHLTSEKNTLSQNLEIRNAENNELANTVDIASTLTASGMSITPLKEKNNGKMKETSFARKVDRLQIAFNIENRITTSGPADLYVIITDPKGTIIQNGELGSGAMTTRQDGDRNFTAKIPVEYETGTRKGVSFPIKNANGFLPGDYRIEVYHNGFKIGEGIRSLKKGLFG